ncbi:recombinase family protein [Rufibacter glacialis]|uniref:Recombinase family protein n=1 Tax=Rufibacter glacialis TaxID=1259555 RepID=A0A5M8QS23_9BACT|nr:recombinase family protein [Rufibacter glacialis]KAA6438031.1 recombinase family protein [Rufibacter glacialis]GGK89570.1 resolvase [Rufibacter glacialis]
METQLAITPETKYVAYYRVSTTKQGESGLGLAAQQSAVKHCVKDPERILASFTEIESGKRNKRPQLAQAIAYAKKCRAVLVIAKLDRLSRNAAFIFMLQETGVDFMCADMPQANTLTIGIFAVLAQNERETISKRTREALQAKKAMDPDWKPGTPANLTQQGREASLATRRRDAQENENNRRAAAYIKQLRDNLVAVTDENGKPTGEKRQRTWREIAAQLNQDTYRTSKGGLFQATQVMRLYQAPM